MTDARARLISWCLIVLAAALPARADGDQWPTPAPPMPPDLPGRVREVTDVVLEYHNDPPTRQAMILSGLKMLYQEAGVPAPLGLGRRASAVMTTEQIAALLKETWPATTARPVSAHVLEEAMLGRLVGAVPGDAEWMTAKEGKVAEQFAGNRYVGPQIALGMGEKTQRPVMADVFPGGPADRAGIQNGDLMEEIDGVATEGQELDAVVDRLRGEDGTDVTIKVRRPKDNTVRTLTITRGTLPRATIGGYRKRLSGEWTLRINGPAPIGCLRINEIMASTPHEARKLAARMESEGLRALVLDLRGAQTGRGDSVHPAVLLADSLLESGTIGRVRTVRGETTYQADSDALFRGWPIAVLVDQNTSGTAEWIAVALQDDRRAVVVGSATRGAHIAAWGRWRRCPTARLCSRQASQANEGFLDSAAGIANMDRCGELAKAMGWPRPCWGVTRQILIPASRSGRPPPVFRARDGPTLLARPGGP